MHYKKSIRVLKFNNRYFRHLKTSLCKTVINSSFVIFKPKYSKYWFTPMSYCNV